MSNGVAYDLLRNDVGKVLWNLGEGITQKHGILRLLPCRLTRQLGDVLEETVALSASLRVQFSKVNFLFTCHFSNEIIHKQKWSLHYAQIVATYQSCRNKFPVFKTSIIAELTLLIPELWTQKKHSLNHSCSPESLCYSSISYQARCLPKCAVLSLSVLRPWATESETFLEPWLLLQPSLLGTVDLATPHLFRSTIGPLFPNFHASRGIKYLLVRNSLSCHATYFFNKCS